MTKSDGQDIPCETLLERAIRVPQHVVYREFVAETVALNLNTGKYHGLNPTAGRMLETMGRAPTMRDAARELAAAYDQPPEAVEQDLCALCRDLLTRNLIEAREP